MARDNLKRTRLANELTQQDMADKLGMSLRNYQRIERGEIIGTVEVWDDVERILTADQKWLRLIADNGHAPTKNP